MTRNIRVCLFAALGFAQAALASAQTVPATFTDLQFLVRPGDRVMVVDATGTETAGRISELETSVLSITSREGERRFRQDDVIVIRQLKQDSLRNGIAIGAAIGAGLGLVSEISCGGNDEYCGELRWLTIATTMWGAAIGTLADLVHRTPRDVFRHGPNPGSNTLSVGPLVGHRTAGAQVALRW